jgi:hypothetical protein
MDNAHATQETPMPAAQQRHCLRSLPAHQVVRVGAQLQQRQYCLNHANFTEDAFVRTTK